MGKFEEPELKSIVQRQFQQHKPENTGEVDGVFTVEKEIAQGIKKELQTQYGGNWNVILGKSIVVNLGLHPNERSAHFTFNDGNQDYNVLMFEYNPKQ